MFNGFNLTASVTIWRIDHFEFEHSLVAKNVSMQKSKFKNLLRGREVGYSSTNKRIYSITNLITQNYFVFMYFGVILNYPFPYQRHREEL